MSVDNHNILTDERARSATSRSRAVKGADFVLPMRSFRRVSATTPTMSPDRADAYFQSTRSLSSLPRERNLSVPRFPTYGSASKATGLKYRVNDEQFAHYSVEQIEEKLDHINLALCNVAMIREAKLKLDRSRPRIMRLMGTRSERNLFPDVKGLKAEQKMWQQVLNQRKVAAGVPNTPFCRNEDTPESESHSEPEAAFHQAYIWRRCNSMRGVCKGTTAPVSGSPNVSHPAVPMRTSEHPLKMRSCALANSPYRYEPRELPVQAVLPDTRQHHSIL